MRSDLRCERLLRLGLPENWRLGLRLLPEDWRLGLRLLPEDWRLGLGFSKHWGLWLRFPEYGSLACLLSEYWGLGNGSGLSRGLLLGGRDSSKGLVTGKCGADNSSLSINSLGGLRVHRHWVVADNAQSSFSRPVSGSSVRARASNAAILGLPKISSTGRVRAPGAILSTN